jgi:hypothetical protein
MSSLSSAGADAVRRRRRLNAAIKRSNPSGLLVALAVAELEMDQHPLAVLEDASCHQKPVADVSQPAHRLVGDEADDREQECGEKISRPRVEFWPPRIAPRAGPPGSRRTSSRGTALARMRG